MKRMKKFLIYTILVIIVIVATDFIADLCLESGYKPIYNYEIATTSPKIEIIEAKTTNANGTIKGTVTNETNQFMQNLFIKMELLSDIGNTLGTEYLQVGNLQPQQSKEFELNYRYNKVDRFVVSVTNEVTEEVLEYHPLIEHARTYFTIAKFVVFISLPPLYIWSAFLK